MTTKISKREIASVHASVDELAAAAPEAFAHLSGLLNFLMSSTASIEVPVKGKAGKRSTAVQDDFEDDDDVIEGDDDDDAIIDDEDEGDDDGEGDDDDDAIIDDEDEEGDGEDDEEGESDFEAPELENIDDESIMEAFDNFDPNGNVHDSLEGVGVRELATRLQEFGFEASDIYSAANAKKPDEKKEALQETLTRLLYIVDAISEFELADIETYAAEYDDEFKPMKRGTADAKTEHAAKALLAAVIANSAE